MNKKFENQNIALLLLAIFSGGTLAFLVLDNMLVNLSFSLHQNTFLDTYAIILSNASASVLPIWFGALFVGSGFLTFSKRLRKFFGGEKRLYCHSAILFFTSALITTWLMFVSAFPFLQEKFGDDTTTIPLLSILILQIYIFILSVGELLRRKFAK